MVINKQPSKKVFVVANMHAREWAAMTSAIYIIHELILNSNNYPEASTFQWIVVPLPNPDGYMYTRLERLWRKNRAAQQDNATGVDLNRNFAYKWELNLNEEDDDPHKETYRGPSAFSEVETLEAKYPDKCKVEPIGRSYEGRDINAIYINKQQNKKVFVVANMHAREWAAMTSAIYIIRELLRNSNSYPEASTYQWIVVPMANPDGYEYTKADDRFWRKNRAPQQDNALGVDLNRNFGYKWELYLNEEDDIPNEQTYRVYRDFKLYQAIFRVNTQLWLDALATENPQKCQLQKLEETYEGRNVSAIVINYNLPKKIIVIGNLQAREWVGMTSAVYIIHELILNAGNYPDANKFQWIIVPMPNPDGYEFSREHDRKWNKNRSPQSNANFGVNLDSNFNNQWNVNGNPSRADPAGRVYRGPAPFSEPETRALRDLMHNHVDAVLLVDLQGFGQLILMPWSWTEEPAPNADRTRAIAIAALLFSGKVSVEKIGETALGRDINVININYNAKKKVILVANLHAREWAAMSAALYIISELVYNGDQYPELSQFRWMIIPMANPDGYDVIDDPTDALHRFLSYDETNEFMFTLLQLFPKQVSVEKLGETWLGRDINMMTINYNARDTIVLVANLHAREWAAMTTALFIIFELVYNGHHHPELSQFRWMIIPIANPDGYEFTRERDRYWSKNRSPQPDSQTFGVDLNGNFAYKWEENDRPVEPKDRTYNGPQAGSEPETRAISKLLESIGPDILLFVDMHTFGNHIFHPWSYSTEPAENVELTKAVAHAGADAIRFKYEEYYTVGTPSQLYRRVYGTPIDYCQSLRIRVCLWLEMTNSGFQFEASRIMRYGEEGWTAIKAMALKAAEVFDEKQIDFAEQLESVAYVLCGDGTVTYDKFCQIWHAKGILDKLYRLIDVDCTNLISTNQIMEFISNLTNSRSSWS
uniref:Peptidase M14 domain-containing protein n=1 Tax=Anopheles melas TaxID=34690 RepID=A0A182UEK2_9DIPT